MNKPNTFKFAENLGFPIPKTIKVNSRNLAQIKGFVNENNFPLVIKGSKSGVENLKYCNNNRQLVIGIKRLLRSEKEIICQEYINGTAHGFYAFYDNGRMIAKFMHKRIKQFPVTGGASAVARSYSDDRLETLGKLLLDKLKWNGPAMVEFKLDSKDLNYKLIEINPKLWGSLDLTVSSGIDIPELYVEKLKNKKSGGFFVYKDNIYRWIFPSEALHFIASGFGRIKLPSRKYAKHEIHQITKSGDFGDSKVYTNIDKHDLAPSVFQFILFVAKLMKYLVKGVLSKPSGYPNVR